MRSIKAAFMLIGALIPVVYIGSLLLHFYNVGGSVDGINTIGLGPTVVGLGVTGLGFVLALLFKIRGIFLGSHSGGPRPRLPGKDDDDDDANAIDADAAIARYKAERAAEAAAGRPVTRPSGFTGAPAKGFGRRTS